MIINTIVTKLDIIKKTIIILPCVLIPSLAQAEYYFVYPAPAPASCVTCHVVRPHIRRVHRPCKPKRVFHRVKRHRCYTCPSVSVSYVVPAVSMESFAGYYPSNCYNNECYRYNPDFTTGDDEVVTYPDMDSQY